jgi:hypothetical protein
MPRQVVRFSRMTLLMKRNGLLRSISKHVLHECKEESDEENLEKSISPAEKGANGHIERQLGWINIDWACC